MIAYIQGQWPCRVLSRTEHVVRVHIEGSGTWTFYPWLIELQRRRPNLRGLTTTTS